MSLREHCPACGLQVGGRGEVPELALSRSERFVRVLSTPLVELPYRSPATRTHDTPDTAHTQAHVTHSGPDAWGQRVESAEGADSDTTEHPKLDQTP